MSNPELLAAYETELRYVQGNAPDDAQRIKDIEAEIARLKPKKRSKTTEKAVRSSEDVERAVAVEE